MMEKSAMTTERGLAENLCLSIQKTVEREDGTKTCINLWHKKRNNAWCANLYVTAERGNKKPPLCDHGEGWDITSAVESLRENFLKEKSKQYETTFTNLLEFDMWLDQRDKVERNDVGAVVDYEVKEDSAIQAILKQMDELQKAISKIKK
jgi:hypothetical protein